MKLLLIFLLFFSIGCTPKEQSPVATSHRVYSESIVKDMSDKQLRVIFNNFEFNQGNMFISNSSSLINSYFSEVFDWLKKCESLFGFDLKGYNKVRMYTFLAERFLPFWFKKYTKFKILPIQFKDISDFL